MWQFSEIGQGKKYEVKEHPVTPFYEEKMPFFDVGDSFGIIQTQSKNEIDIPCTDKACFKFQLLREIGKTPKFWAPQV